MKKLIPSLLALGLLAALAAPAAARPADDDFKAIQNAVAKSPAPAPVPAGEARWFKVLVTEHGREAVRITLPIRVVELLAKCSNDRHMRIHDPDCDLDLAELLSELRKSGPEAIIEIRDDDSIVKVWFE